MNGPSPKLHRSAGAAPENLGPPSEALLLSILKSEGAKQFHSAMLSKFGRTIG